MKPSLIADQLADIEQRLAVIYAEKEALIKKTVDECDHPIESIYERPYQDNSWLGYEKPWLICSKCGYTEEGWYCGYRFLRHAEHKKVPTVTRAQWNSMRTLTMSQRDLNP
jgi:hypothetical protein